MKYLDENDLASRGKETIAILELRDWVEKLIDKVDALERRLASQEQAVNNVAPYLAVEKRKPGRPPKVNGARVVAA